MVAEIKAYWPNQICQEEVECLGVEMDVSRSVFVWQCAKLSVPNSLTTVLSLELFLTKISDFCNKNIKFSPIF